VFDVLVTSLTIQDFRCLSLKSINLKTPITILIGDNNAGKTSILEAIYFCSNLKSFKSISNQNLIKNTSQIFKISLNYTYNHLNNNIFIEKSLKSSKCTLNNKKISKQDLYNKFPCYCLVFGFNNILLNDSSYRREFLDSGMFHVEPGSQSAVNRLNKTIKQRNYLLKSKKFNELSFWDNQLVDVANVVHKYRIDYFKLLKQQLYEIIDNLNRSDNEIYQEIATLDIDYLKGYRSSNFFEELRDNLNKDISLGYTSSGTHRCDFKILSYNRPVKESGSMSTLVLACLVVYLAKINVFHVKHGYKPTLLIDDLFFGIDDKNLNTVIKLLVNSKGSFIVSSPSIYEEMLDKVVQENKQITVLNIGDR
jgi:DNA replication and repair protein RecF